MFEIFSILFSGICASFFVTIIFYIFEFRHDKIILINDFISEAREFYSKIYEIPYIDFSSEIGKIILEYYRDKSDGKIQDDIYYANKIVEISRDDDFCFEKYIEHYNDMIKISSENYKKLLNCDLSKLKINNNLFCFDIKFHSLINRLICKVLGIKNTINSDIIEILNNNANIKKDISYWVFKYGEFNYSNIVEAIKIFIIRCKKVIELSSYEFLYSDALFVNRIQNKFLQIQFDEHEDDTDGKAINSLFGISDGFSRKYDENFIVINTVFCKPAYIIENLCMLLFSNITEKFECIYLNKFRISNKYINNNVIMKSLISISDVELEDMDNI